jgi:hypothetical protein
MLLLLLLLLLWQTSPFCIFEKLPNQDGTYCCT